MRHGPSGFYHFQLKSAWSANKSRTMFRQAVDQSSKTLSSTINSTKKTKNEPTALKVSDNGWCDSFSSWHGP
ncbi:hypothetical protein TMatcc_006013 [Talaromyces marneffei ATCC 18224]